MKNDFCSNIVIAAILSLLLISAAFAEGADSKTTVIPGGSVFEGLGLSIVQVINGNNLEIGDAAYAYNNTSTLNKIEDGKIFPVKKSEISVGDRIAYILSGDNVNSIENLWIIKDKKMYDEMLKKGFRITDKGVELAPSSLTDK